MLHKCHKHVTSDQSENKNRRVMLAYQIK